MGTILRTARRQINISVSQAVYERIEGHAKAANETVAAYSAMMLDAAIGALLNKTPNAKLDAQVAMVGLATLADCDIDRIAAGSGLTITTVTRMRDAWRSVLDERRQAR